VAKTNAAPAARGGSRTTANDGGGFLGADRWDRIIGAAFFGVMILSIVAFIVLMFGAFTGFLNTSNTELYALLLGVPFIGLPIAVILLIVLLVRMTIRRRRENAGR